VIQINVIAMHVKWEGIYPAVTTKFDENDQLDLFTFGKNIEAQLDAGVSGIILGGTLGEASSLTTDEKQTILRETVKKINGRVPVILNIAEQTTRAAIAFAIDAKKNGADGLMLLPPMRYAADDVETVSYFKAVANATDLPIMIYNNPIDYKVMVTLDMFRELASVPTIQAIKESSRDITYLTRLKIAFGDRYKILSGVDNLALESILMGADGWVAGLVCAFPAETVAIFKLAKAGKIQEAIELYRWFIPLLELDISSKLVQNIKLAEVATDIGTERVRAPRLSLAGEERERVQKIITDSLAKRPILPDYKSL
jgi:dihydrodipicolinate synthase/N-acetylneuraminate lyase